MEEFHRRPAFWPHLIAQWRSHEQPRVTFSLECWQHTALALPSSSPGGSELTDPEAHLSAGSVVLAAIPIDLYAALWAFVSDPVVGLMGGPERIDKELPRGVDALIPGVSHAQESSLVLGCGQLSQGLVLSCRTWGGQLSSSLCADLLGILKRFFRACRLKDLLPDTPAIREEHR